MGESSTVSVLMGVYNEEEYLSEAIESILGQTYRDLEFIVVDDGSDDGSVDVVESYDDPRIVLVENETNRGLPASLNRGLERATGTYVARQDADDRSIPERFERQVSFLERNDDVALVGTGTHLIDGHGDVIDHRVGYRCPSFEELLEKNHLVHGSILARRSVLAALGGYDEFYRYGQDYELWLRLTRRHCVSNIPEPLYQLRIHDDSVYFSQKDESALYERLARDIATGRIEAALKDELREHGIERYYDHLSEERRAAFHRDLAARYLRYGHVEPALEECRRARRYDRLSVKTWLLTLIGSLGGETIEPIRWGMRRYLNGRTRISNRIRAPTTNV